MRRLLDRKILVKAVGYRFFVALFDVAVLSLSFGVTNNIVVSVVVLNALKILGYYFYDILWLKPEVRTPLRIIDRVLKALRAGNAR